VFFVNVPVGLVAMPVAWRLLPRTNKSERRRHDLDLVGVALLGAGAVVLLLPFVQEQTWKGQTKWLLVPAALVLLAAFVAWDLMYKRRGKSEAESQAVRPPDRSGAQPGQHHPSAAPGGQR
jgi:hypothetical protein